MIRAIPQRTSVTMTPKATTLSSFGLVFLRRLGDRGARVTGGAAVYPMAPFSVHAKAFRFVGKGGGVRTVL